MTEENLNKFVDVVTHPITGRIVGGEGSKHPLLQKSISPPHHAAFFNSISLLSITEPAFERLDNL